MSNEAAEWCLSFTSLCLPSSDWAAWVQAIFSAAAVISAIGVVAWQIRTNHSTYLTSARLAAGGLLTHMDQTIAGLDVVNEKISARITNGVDVSNSSAVLYAVLATLPLPERDDLFQLNHGLPRCAISLRQATNSVIQVIAALKTFSETTDQLCTSSLKTFYALLADSRNAFISAKRELDKFVP